MKILAITLTILIAIQLSACTKEGSFHQTTDSGVSPETNPAVPSETITTKMKITIGSAVFTATFYDNVTATAFKAMLPLTIDMRELNGNEKFYYFPTTFPTNASNGGNIQAGDLMLYGNNCLVLFYQNFNASYSYTRIGRIDNISGLITAVGSGNVSIKYEIQ